MMIYNEDLRQEIKKSRLYHHEIAKAAGIDPCTLSRWLRYELTPQRREKIKAAIDALISNDER